SHQQADPNAYTWPRLQLSSPLRLPLSRSTFGRRSHCCPQGPKPQHSPGQWAPAQWISPLSSSTGLPAGEQVRKHGGKDGPSQIHGLCRGPAIDSCSQLPGGGTPPGIRIQSRLKGSGEPFGDIRDQERQWRAVLGDFRGHARQAIPAKRRQRIDIPFRLKGFSGSITGPAPGGNRSINEAVSADVEALILLTHNAGHTKVCHQGLPLCRKQYVAWGNIT